ncbi:MAG: hypothetical protein NVSMB52_20230 [Chloroflexota bacterium]
MSLDHTLPRTAPSILVARGSDIAANDPWSSVRWSRSALEIGGNGIAPNDGVLSIAAKSYPVLLVSGATQQGLLKASTVLADPDEVSAYSSDTEVIHSVPEPAKTPFAWRDGAASFSQLGLDQQHVVGPGQHILQNTFERPAGWMLSDGSTLTLDIVSSPAVSSRQSWIAISVNGKDLGAQKLQEGHHRYRFFLPPDRLNTTLGLQPLRQLAITNHIFLDLEQRQCSLTNPEAVWSTILPSSVLLLPHTDYSGFDLGRFPSPLGGSQGAVTTIVLPNRPDDSDVMTGLQLLAALGRWAQGPSMLPVLTTASNLRSRDRANEDLILVGDSSRNTVIADGVKKNASLFQIVQPPVTTTRSRQSAVLRFGRSPWSSSHTVLAVLSANSASLPAAARALSLTGLEHRVFGTTVEVDGSTVRSIDAANPAEPSPSSLAPRVVSPAASPPGPPAWQVVGGVLLVAFLAIIALIAALLVRRGRRVALDGE